MSADRFQQSPRRQNCSSTIRPVVFSHSLTRGIHGVRPLRNAAPNAGPVNAASAYASSSSTASRQAPSTRILSFSRSKAWA